MIYHGVRYLVIGDFAIRELRFILAQDEFETNSIVIEEWIRDFDQKDGNIRQVYMFNKTEPDTRRNLTEAYGKWFDLIAGTLPSISRSDLEQCHELDRKRWPKTKDFDRAFELDEAVKIPDGATLVYASTVRTRLVPEGGKKHVGHKDRELPANVLRGALDTLHDSGVTITETQMVALITGDSELWGIVHASYWDNDRTWDTQDRETLMDAVVRSIIGMSHWPTFGEKNSDYDCQFDQKVRDLIAAGVLIDTGFLKHGG